MLVMSCDGDRPDTDAIAKGIVKPAREVAIPAAPTSARLGHDRHGPRSRLR
jgi:hypothetical protein